LFYKDAKRRALSPEFPLAQRLRYVFAGFVVPLALAIWAALALLRQSAEMLGIMIQLMFLLVGWHYVKQGFGVFTVLSARRGVRVSARERTVFLAHCFAGWAYAWAHPATPRIQLEEKGVVFWGIARPPWLEAIALAALVVSTLALLWTVFAKRRREG